MSGNMFASQEDAYNAGRAEALTQAARIAESEPEPEGEPPSPLRLLPLKDAVGAVVRATRNSIAQRIRAEMSN